MNMGRCRLLQLDNVAKEGGLLSLPQNGIGRCRGRLQFETGVYMKMLLRIVAAVKRFGANRAGKGIAGA